MQNEYTVYKLPKYYLHKINPLQGWGQYESFLHRFQTEGLF